MSRNTKPEESGLTLQDSSTRQYPLPDEYAALDELAAPAPIGHSPENTPSNPLDLQSAQLERGEAHQGKNKCSGATSREDDDESYDYANLNELAGPAPAENPQARILYHHHDLEEARSKEQEYDPRKHQEQQEDPTSPDLRQGEQRSTSNVSTGKSKHITHLYVTSYLIFFSILGTLARIGLQALTRYPGAPVAFSELWANVGGCAIMGYLSEDRSLFRRDWETSMRKARESVLPGEGDASDSDKESAKASMISAAREAHRAMTKTIPLFIGLSVGFCGSFTSFSSFIRDVFLALANDLDTQAYTATTRNTSPKPARSAGYSVMAVLAVLVVETCACLSALIFGAHVAIALQRFTFKIPKFATRRVLDPLVVPIAWGCWIGAVVMAIWPPDRFPSDAQVEHLNGAHESWRGKVLFAIVLAPLGCLVRFHASLRLNGLVIWFPMGTFAVNVGGTIILGACWDLQHAALGGGGVGGAAVGCQVLEGVQDGFCGCVTTVSTWVMELKGLQRRHAYFYGMMSVGISMSALVVIMGTFLWTKGNSPIACRV